ncbi:hypothetical protein CGLO_04571 [Colletotrichum gloeosporioides Cg-14]|uniref:Uncharacterized protein n=1 Tax=Colletotrichum gloeosporioides (strain Cg-14) TaxID=1237896 RepID=T0LUQ5_COLGC|nr:hypothetical protein CGLO_04571 [Colletotrichum gloeosporioides Cg-14]
MSAFSATDDQEMANLLVLAAATNEQTLWAHEAATEKTSLGLSCNSLTKPSGCETTESHLDMYHQDLESGITNAPNGDGPHPRRESLPDTLFLDDLLCIESNTPTSFELTLALEYLG